MFTNVGVAKSAIVTTVLVMGVSFIPTMFIQWKGAKLRGNSTMSERI